MVARSFTKYKHVILVLVLFVPSIWFATDYALSATPSLNRGEHYSLTSSDQGWSVNMTVSHPSYFITGQQIPVSFNFRLLILDPNITIGLNDMRVEVRDPLKINPTTGAVEEWRTLSSTQAAMLNNYTASNTISKVVNVVATYPPSSSFFDPFIPTGKIALNGVVDYTLYQSDGNTTTANPQSISLMDSQTFYQTQLSVIRSASSWIVYQLSTAWLVSLVYLRMRPIEVNPADKMYALQLESYRIERRLANLEGLMNSGRISEIRYGELKEDYEKELAQIRSVSKVTS